jgi:protein gp37
MSKIEWTGETWNPIVGCSVVSPGCTNCYAMRMAARLEAMATANRPKWTKAHRNGQMLAHYIGTTKLSKAGPVWTGKVAPAPEHVLTAPLRRRKPTTYFVNSMSDLFHEDMPDEWIDRVFAVMALCQQHRFQCLTKRSSRMKAYCTAPDVTHRIAKAMDAIRVNLEHDPVESWAQVPGYPDYEASSHGRVRRAGLILKPQMNERFSRLSISLWKDNKPSTRWVHSLVLLAHRGPPPEGQEACHRNGDQIDNRIANLRWGTRNENQQEKVRHGSNGGPAKLTREQAAEIRAARARGETQQSIADRVGVSRSLVSMIESGSVWADAMPWPLPTVWLGVSTEDQRRADERIPDLLSTPAAVRFVSAEPLLGPIDFNNIDNDGVTGLCTLEKGPIGLDWIVVGGESGPNARPMQREWAESIVRQCRDAGVSVFVKQLGAAYVDEKNGVAGAALRVSEDVSDLISRRLRNRKGADMDEWPQSLRIREMPSKLSEAVA